MKLDQSTAPSNPATQPVLDTATKAPINLDHIQKPSVVGDPTVTTTMTQSNHATVSTLGLAEQAALSSAQKITIASGTSQHPLTAGQSKFSPSSTVSEIPAEAGTKSMTTPLAPISTQQNTPSLQSGSENQISSIAASGTPEFINWDTTQPVSSPQNNSSQLRGDLAPHVARQLVEVMTHAANRPVEIALSPHELGRVRMSIVADDNAITVNIVAERGETVDLMRRHIDQLGQTFRSMGYDQINFEFSQSSQDSDHTEGGSSGEQTETKSGSDKITDALLGEESSIIHLNNASADGVDIRL